MGILCSKSLSLSREKVSVDAGSYEVNGGIQSCGFRNTRQRAVEPKRSILEKQLLDHDDQQPEEDYLNSVGSNNLRESDLDDYYDGIPRVPTALLHKSRSMRSTQAAVAKVTSNKYLHDRFNHLLLGVYNIRKAGCGGARIGGSRYGVNN